jgi:acetyltransferase-like isoleucine patch superfamily enzyme
MIYKIISKIKGEDYQGNYNYSFLEGMLILFQKSIELLRGMCFKIRTSKSGKIFAKKGAKIVHGRKIIFGNNVSLGRYALINGLSIRGVVIGKNFSIGDFSTIECTGIYRAVGDRLIIGDNVGINSYCFIGVRGEVIIGDNVIFGPRVTILSEQHNYKNIDELIKLQGEKRYKTVIEDNVWVGAGATIMPGVTIKTGTVVGAGAVVTKDTDFNAIVAGGASKKIKTPK